MEYRTTWGQHKDPQHYFLICYFIIGHTYLNMPSRGYPMCHISSNEMIQLHYLNPGLWSYPCYCIERFWSISLRFMVNSQSLRFIVRLWCLIENGHLSQIINVKHNFKMALNMWPFFIVFMVHLVKRKGALCLPRKSVLCTDCVKCTHL